MALLGNIDDSYTSTGKGPLTRWSNRISLIPGIRKIGDIFGKVPFVSGTFGALLGYVDTAIESAQWLFRGQFGSAATTAIAGFVGTSVNFASEGTGFWWANAASGVATGATLGTHARALTESIIGGVTGVLGSKPQVLSSYTAGIGNIGTSVAPAGPGKFASNVAAERGQNADEAYNRYISGEGGAHVNELQSAYGRGA
ncbi:MAG: hypothetical protein SFW64_08175 [Alphaproteobacteria bacterium]|nr:hypothetical protein [Alphaproteobacteria bacterium]